jgi:hypothetical protein
MRLAAVFLGSLALLGCATQDADRVANAAQVDSGLQTIVDRIASGNPDVARLSIHAIPSGQSRMLIVASTVAGRIGEPSDAEDMEAARTGRSVVIREAHNLDYTEPVADASGRTTAVVGVTISGATGADAEALLARAKTVAAETAAAVRSAR